MNAQCVAGHTIALVCSSKIGNDWQHWKPLKYSQRLSYPMKSWEQCNTMGAII